LRFSASAWHQGGRPTGDAVRDWSWGGGVEVEQPPDAAGEVAFEAADRFAFGLAFGCLSLEVGAGGGVPVALGERDDVDRAVELAVPGTSRPARRSSATGTRSATTGAG
jgi:hypothetical protein